MITMPPHNAIAGIEVRVEIYRIPVLHQCSKNIFVKSRPALECSLFVTRHLLCLVYQENDKRKKQVG